VIHERSAGPAGEDVNVAGTRRLIEAARAAGVRRFVFASSHSAAAEAPTSYGRTKHAIERLLAGEGEVAVRFGLVCGAAPRGVFGRLLALGRRHRILPVVGARAPVYPIHVGDACALLLALVRAERPPGRLVWAAGREAVPFADFLRTLARARLGARLRLLPVPAWPVQAACALAETVGLRALPTERLRGLLALRPVDPALPGPADLGLALRDWRGALDREGRRRRLLAEGRALARYVLGRPPPAGVARRYARAVAAEADADPLDLPPVLLVRPALLRAVEPFDATGTGLARRLALALALVEMTPAGAPRFHAYRARSAPAALAALIGLGLTEAGFAVLRLLGSRIVSRRR
jgi:NADH dehydrogenase